MNTSQIGAMGEAKALAAFTKYGLSVFLPFGDGCSTDMIVSFGGKLNRIQVKTTTKIDDTLMHWKVGKQDNGVHGSLKAYSLEEADYFVLYCSANNRMFLVANPQNTEEYRIRLDTYTGRRQPKMHFASEHDFDKVLSEIISSSS